VRYFVPRFATFVLLLAAAPAFSQSPYPVLESQSPSSSSAPGQTAPTAVAPEVLAAEASIVKADWKTAETSLEAYLAVHPADARALFDAGYVADTQDRLDDAGALYRRAIAANPKSFEAHLSLGLLLARQGKQEEARPELAAATTLDPGDAGPALKARAWRALAEIDRNSNATMASNELLEALKLTPETESDTLLAADLADLNGQHDAAEAAYRRVLATDPKSPAANSGLAHMLIARKQYPEAETLLNAALLLIPGDTTLTAQLAIVLAAENKPDALPLLEKLYAAHPEDPAILHMLAQFRAQAGDAAGSDQLYLKLLAASPANPDLLIAHAGNLIHLLNYREAFAAFSKATEVDPANANAWSGLAFAASRTNQPAVTLHALTMRSRSLPENPSTYFLWAGAYDALNDRKQAIVYYHHFLDAAAGKFPNQEWHARQRLHLLEGQ
jgi:tetratricopeptide (TPR) repeat protein